jgi:site-specific recombinase XerD
MNKDIYLAVVNRTNESAGIPTPQESSELQAKLLGLWEQQQKVLGYTDGTIALSISNVNEFLDVAGKFIWEVDIHDFDNFYMGLVGRGLAYSTRRKYQSNIITFLDYLRSRHSREIWERYRVQVPTVLDKFNRHHHRNDDNDGQVTPPAPDVLDRFWNGMKEMMKTARKYATAARDYTLFKMLELSGLRIFEAAMLDVKDCRFDLGENGKIHVRFGKGSKGTGYKRRWVPMLDDLDKLLTWYLQKIRPLFTDEESGALFLSEKRRRLERDTSRQVLRRRQLELGFRSDEMFSPHQLRHAFATRQTERGVDLLTLKTLLGHVDIATTFTYSTPGSDFLEKRVRMSQEKWRQELLAKESDERKG